MFTEEEIFLLKKSVDDTINNYEKDIERVMSSPEQGEVQKQFIRDTQEIISKYAQLKKKLTMLSEQH